MVGEGYRTIKIEKGTECAGVAFVQCNDVTEFLEALKRILNCISVKWSPSTEMNHGVCVREFKHRVLKVRE